MKYEESGTRGLYVYYLVMGNPPPPWTSGIMGLAGDFWSGL